MTSSQVRDLIERHVQTVGLPLYEGVSAGVDQALIAMGRLSHVEYPWLLSGHARAAMRDHWLRHLNGSGSGWTVAGRPQLMGETILVNRRHRLALRLLKENRRVHPGGVPTAGLGATRRKAWQEPLPGLAYTQEGHERLDGVAECLLLWSLGFDAKAPIISVRVVHTVGPGSYGHRVPIDLSFAINPQGQMFEDLGFPGDPQNEDLFPTIVEEENEGDFGI